MNLYLRFFNDEVLVESVEQAIDFLSRISEIAMSEALCTELRHYAEGKNPYPKRFKVGPKVYFIVIKTTAQTMEEFKAYAAEAGNSEERAQNEKEMQASAIVAENPGWYQAYIKFKRVLPVEETSKFRYVDTEFEAKVKADSVQDCYNRIVDHLRNRADVDQRSQFPSVKGRNFKAEFLGMR